MLVQLLKAYLIILPFLPLPVQHLYISISTYFLSYPYLPRCPTAVGLLIYYSTPTPEKTTSEGLPTYHATSSSVGTISVGLLFYHPTATSVRPTSVGLIIYPYLCPSNLCRFYYLSLPLSVQTL